MVWTERTYPEHERLSPRVAILPLGAVEAHGPHLPVGTDIWIAEAMARRGGELLAAEGIEASVLPTLTYAPAPFADEFAGTLSIRPETMRALVVDIGRAVARRGIAVLALANAHFDPAQINSLRAAGDELRSSAGPRLAFPDLTRHALALRMGDEFRSGACHAGQYETSILLAEKPDLVDDEARRTLPARPVSLVTAFRDERRTFGEAGLERAYCGDPAAADAESGRRWVEELGAILAEAVRAELG